jgi:hypothetical protein
MFNALGNSSVINSRLHGPEQPRAMLRVEPPHEPFGRINMARRRGQQKGYVHRQGNMWYLAYREDALDKNGNLIRIRRNRPIASAKEVTKREAQRMVRQILNDVDEQAQRPQSLFTVQEFIDTRFVPDVVWALKHAGQKHYDYVLGKHVVPAIGAKRLRDISNDDVQVLVRAKIESGYSVQTAVHIRNAISAVFIHAKLKRAFSARIRRKASECRRCGAGRNMP